MTIKYPIERPYGGSPLSKLRVKRLLLLALSPSAWHKRFYSQYCALINEGLTGWVFGTAYITEEGLAELERLKNE